MSKSKRRNQRQAGPSAPSTSSRGASSGEDALEFLFSYPPKFIKQAGFEGSVGTRDPVHYDMHLHSQLILKDVVSFPDMLEQLAGVVDSKRFPSTGNTRSLPRVPYDHDLHRLRVREKLQAGSGITIGPEADLQKQYPELQKLASLIASTLFAGLGQWSNIFRFSDNPTSTMACAIADGYLSPDKAAVEKARLPKDLDSDIQLVIKKGLSDFLFWEFKSMNAGSEGVMRAISHLAGSKFPWVRCPTSQSCNAQFCKKLNNRFQFTVTGHKTGVDGDIFEDLSDADCGVSNSGGIRLDRSKTDSSVVSVLDTSGWKFKCAERKTPKGTKKRRKSGDGSDEVEGDDIEDDEGANDRLPFNEGDFKKALKIIQQVWAEAVNVDATFMVLNAGSREFIGIRDRKLQRLYLSPLIDLDDPHSLPAGYFKIHTGLQIAALHDVIQRAKRLQQLEALSQAPKLHTFIYDRAEPYQDRETRITKMPRLSGSTTTANEAKAKMLQDRTKLEDSNLQNFSSGSELTSEELKLFQQLREASSLKISWNTYIDHLGPAGSKTVTRSNASPPNDIGMEVHIMDCYPKCAQSYYCYADNGETAVRGIVIKCHQGAAEIRCLRDEYEMYTKLWEIGTVAESLGIPEHFGLYEGEHYMVLVLLDSGDPALKKFGNRTPKDIYSQVQSAVEKMHFAMITHGSLAPENILVTKQEKQSQWNIHVISWKNGQDHRLLLTVQKANSSIIRRESSLRRPSKEKARGKLLSKKASYGEEQRGTDSDQAASPREWTTRSKENPSMPYVCKSLFSTLKQEWDVAVEKDKRMMDQTVWNRY